MGGYPTVTGIRRCGWIVVRYLDAWIVPAHGRECHVNGRGQVIAALVGCDQDVCRQVAVHRIVHTVEVTIAIVLAIFPQVVNRCSAAGLGEVSLIVVTVTTVMMLSHAHRFPPVTLRIDLLVVFSLLNCNRYIYGITRLTCRSCSSPEVHAACAGSSSSAAKLARHKPYGLPATSISDDWQTST